MDNIIINPDNYLSKNTYKVNISYCYKPNIFKPFLFTLGENKIPWLYK